MKVSHLIEELEKMPPDAEVVISVDVSEVGDEDNAGRRAFGEEYDGWQENGGDEVSILFIGHLNHD